MTDSGQVQKRRHVCLKRLFSPNPNEFGCSLSHIEHDTHSDINRTRPQDNPACSLIIILNFKPQKAFNETTTG